MPTRDGVGPLRKEGADELEARVRAFGKPLKADGTPQEALRQILGLPLLTVDAEVLAQIDTLLAKLMPAQPTNTPACGSQSG